MEIERVTNAPWELLDDVGGNVGSLGDHERARRAARVLAALAETAGEVIRGGRKSAASAGAKAAKAVLDDVRTTHDASLETPASIAGRLAMLTDILAITASRRAPDDILDVAKQHLGLLKAVHGGATSLKDLADALGVTVETACRQVREARAAGLLDHERAGRNVENRVSDLVLALDDAGLLALTRPQGFSMASVLANTPASNEPPRRREGVPQLGVAG